jgi:arginine decarboxylase
MIPRYYFVVSGSALSPVSPLNAFDGALKEAGIHNLNLVEVSSILPKDITHLELNREEAAFLFEPGELVFAVQARGTGSDGVHVSAGLMWGEGIETNGFVVEHRSSTPSIRAEASTEEAKEELTDMLRSKFQEMARIRGIETKAPRFRTVEIYVPEGMYGCALTFLVLC